MTKIKKISALLLAMAVLLGCTACSSAGSGDPYDEIPESTGGKDIEKAKAADSVFSLNSNSNYSLNPLIATYHANQLVCSLVYENMVEVDNDFNIVKNIIEDWDYSEDYRNWQFTIAKGHFFHDGTELTAKDVRYSLERAISSDRYKGRFNSIQGVSYASDQVYVSLGIGDSNFVKLLNIPVIQNGTYADKYPGGSGPYMYNEDATALIPFEGYLTHLTDDAEAPEAETDKEEGAEAEIADGEADEPEAPADADETPAENLPEAGKKFPVDTIYLKEYTTAEATISAFEDSLIDVVINDPTSNSNLGYASTNEMHAYPTTNLHFVAFNEEHELTSFAAFRFAMNYAFDRSYFAEELLQGYGEGSTVPMYPTCADYPTEFADTLNYDLEKCRVILENAGIRDYNDDGKLEYMMGSPRPIELTMVVCSDSSAKAGVCKRFAADMKSLGLTVNVQELTWSNYLTALEEGEFDMYYGEVKLRNNFDLSELLDVESEMNYTHSIDTSLLTYMQAYLSASEMERPAMYQVFCEYLTSSAASLITIGFEKQQIICHRGVVKGIDANIGNPLYDFQNWTIDLS